MSAWMLLVVPLKRIVSNPKLHAGISEDIKNHKMGDNSVMTQ